MIVNSSSVIGVVGLGYVGLPLAIEFGKQYKTIGLDLKEEVIACYRDGSDPTGEVDDEEFEAAEKLVFTTNAGDLSEADYLIVAVPTPIDEANQPDLSPLVGATRTAGQVLKKGATVVFESTVYPGLTEEVCVPILEKESGLKWKQDFHVGYSPERINPGDKVHTLTRIVKVVSGDDAQCLDAVAALYESVIEAGVFRAASIKEAEAAKVIENTQRDLNIALINELAIIFDRLGIDTLHVLEAAGSKWNFLPFRPGLVGGHCIGVDPYYLTHKAEAVGYNPQVILAGRRINDNMGKFVAEKTVKLLLSNNHQPGVSKVGILGLTFKEDCPDLRNSKVVDIISELEEYGIEPMVYDPVAARKEAEAYMGKTMADLADFKNLGALIIAVPHKQFRDMPAGAFMDMLSEDGCLLDVKSMLDPEKIPAQTTFWRL
ncbi:nucleotide sugar dehydrogenase [Thiolapillus brandeum]|uniref:UDP-N-acetyl-D-galactosamine dehydrogenase n=1 Tax=Thiolapillus brandeum TaxID=1076588 RepID=A0A7U6GKQ7_9GAMM|nr:UDP-N-acetyl-D-galactosamine dehydrogenase [Thiolapillus brandeum]